MTLLVSVAAALLGSLIDGWRMIRGSDEQRRQAEEAYTDPTYVAVTRSTVWIGPWRNGLAEMTGVEVLPLGSVSARRSSRTLLGFEAHRVLLLTFENGRPDLELVVGGADGPLDEVVDAISRAS